MEANDAVVRMVPIAGGATMMQLAGRTPGPTIALLGGVHGDECEGVLAVRRVLAELSSAVEVRGVLRVVAPAHPAAWAADTRVSPIDGLNLARCFPGDRSGRPTEVLAWGLATQVIEGADLLIDLHSASEHNSAQLFCGYCEVGTCAEMSACAARAFGAPMTWSHPSLPPGRTISAAVDRGIPAIYAEATGRGGATKPDLDAYRRGVLQVLSAWGMVHIPASPRVAASRDVFGDGEGAEAPADGFFVPSVEAGDLVSSDDLIGTFYEETRLAPHEIRAPRTGAVMFLRHNAKTRKGESLFVLARMSR